MVAANFLDIPPLLELICAQIACKIKDLSVDQTRTYFNQVNDYNPEEECKIKEENKMALEALDIDPDNS
jgi:hypothetical protein